MTKKCFFLSVFLSLVAIFLSSNVACAYVPPLCGTSANADVVIMIDRTGSLSASEMTQQKNAAKTLLNFFSFATIKPKVAIGTFNVQLVPDARIELYGNLTTTYGHDNPGDTGLYEVINNIPSTGSGSTDLSAGISVAQAELSAHAQSSNRYIVLISDGIANEPDGANPGSCSDHNPGYAANVAASNAEAAGTKIIAVHFGDDGICNPGVGAAFLQGIIATAPATYYEGNGNLSGIFFLISEALVCDDGHACTQDICFYGQCVSTPIGGDSDNDGVSDCLDQCPGGDDNLLGQACSVGSGSCSGSGVKICVCDQGTPSSCSIACNANQGSPTAEICNNVDDDCDGLIDEGFNVGSTCVVGVGLCTNTGQLQCSQTGTAECNASPGVPTVEICDGIDNDCDGQVDEVFDACGVHCGDGSNCDCTEVSFAGDAIQIDSSTLALFKLGKFLGKSSVSAVKKGNGKKGLSPSKAKKIVKKNVAKLKDLQIQSWEDTTSLIQTSITCGDGSACVSVSNVSTLNELYEQNNSMLKIIKKMQKKLGTKSDQKVHSIFEAVLGVSDQNISLITSYPSLVLSCAATS